MVLSGFSCRRGVRTVSPRSGRAPSDKAYARTAWGIGDRVTNPRWPETLLKMPVCWTTLQEGRCRERASEARKRTGNDAPPRRRTMYIANRVRDYLNQRGV